MLTLLAWLALAAPPTCSPAEVCRDVLDSFVGEVVIESAAPAVRLAWSSDSEAGVAGYRLVRLPCAGCAPEVVATVRAADSCGAPATYLVLDADPASRYRLEVWSRAGALACAPVIAVRSP